ncbi:MAG: hypothetical protein COB59_11970 [Rhodospirillaceae bacterium]|nr:MAG: hypothetical protein COB59_11970 [Rhodospirillaceae bacterium]
MAMPKHTNLLTTATLALFLGACAQGTSLYPSSSTSMDPQTQASAQNAGQGATGQSSMPPKAFNRFPDIPVPSGANMDMTRTIVFGSGESWYGQLGLATGHDANSMFDFYKQELPNFAWIEITSVRAPTSVLTYERQGRVISIQLEPATLSGTKVTLTISPRGGATAAPAMAPAPMSAPVGAGTLN